MVVAVVVVVTYFLIKAAVRATTNMTIFRLSNAFCRCPFNASTHKSFFNPSLAIAAEGVDQGPQIKGTFSVLFSNKA